MKIDNDKYYTPIDLANYCWDKTIDIIGIKNISEIIEPSVGNGSFLNHDKYVPQFAYDILPECKSDITVIFKTDYLKTDINYLKGRLIIGNPPYGRCLNLAQKFYKKSVKISDYIAFILPISQLNNSNSLYEFDLIYSEDLGIREYSGIKLHCCFNIYKRNENGLNKPKIKKLKDVKIYRQDCKDYDNKDFDIRMCYWGNGSAGKILKNNEHYSAEYKIKINNIRLKDKIISILSTVDWNKELNYIAMLKIQQFHIYELLKRKIPEIE